MCMDTCRRLYNIAAAAAMLGMVAVVVWVAGRTIAWGWSFRHMPGWMVWQVGAIAVFGVVGIAVFSAVVAVVLVRYVAPLAGKAFWISGAAAAVLVGPAILGYSAWVAVRSGAGTGVQRIAVFSGPGVAGLRQAIGVGERRISGKRLSPAAVSRLAMMAAPGGVAPAGIFSRGNHSGKVEHQGRSSGNAQEQRRAAERENHDAHNRKQ